LGRTLDLPTLRGHIQDRAVARMWLGDGGLGGYLLVGPLVSPFFMTVLEGEIPEIVAEFRAAGMYVDTSWEARRLRDLAVAAQAVSQYYGLDGGDVRTYALRLADLQPQSREAASLLLKVGEHMAWDAEVALEEGPGGRAEELIDQCLELVPDHPRCLAVSLEG